MKPVMLVIMDGFGNSNQLEGNAIAEAQTPNIDRLMKSFPHTSLGAAGLDVGLPEGQMGNSEVGHLNLGAGRIVYQDYTRINLAIKDGSIKRNTELIDAIDRAKNKGASLHLMGLLSDGGVHSHITHLYALLDMAKERGMEKVYVHAILDGRDVPPKSALKYFQELNEKMASIGLGKVATVAGRYYTMDRDKRWDRVEKGYRAMTMGQGFKAPSSEQAVRDGYSRGESDEFIKPTVVDPKGLIKDNDSVIFFNFRPDRARQICKAFVNQDFKEFVREKLNLSFVCMTQYGDTIDAPVVFPVEYLDDTLGEVVSNAGLKQLRIAETEKSAHVTFFFNGGKEETNLNEDRILIPSPKVATYDLQPEMSAFLITDAVVENIMKDVYDMIILNYANADIVGHTGIMDAAVKAVEAVDQCVGRVADLILERGGVILLTADHGNAEQMLDLKTHQPHTAHTTNRVPFAIISREKRCRLRDDGILADVAPTILELLHLEKPPSMTRKSLIVV